MGVHAKERKIGIHARMGMPPNATYSRPEIGHSAEGYRRPCLPAGVKPAASKPIAEGPWDRAQAYVAGVAGGLSTIS